MWEFWKSRNKHTPSQSKPPPDDRIVHFKDLSIRARGQTESVDREAKQRRRRAVEKKKLIVVIVGLPARGKTFVCNKLASYLSWIGHPTRHFNVGSYRRGLNIKAEKQDAEFFDHNNADGVKARSEALKLALEDLLAHLDEDRCQVALFDATNTTEERRRFLIEQFDGYEYLFIESVCNDDMVLEQNLQYKMQYSPDYTGMTKEEALEDFRERIRKYEVVYEPICDRTLPFVKLTDMVTGYGHLDVNRVGGYLGGKIVFFLMQICKAGFRRRRRIWLTRHGESEYNRLGLIGGDSQLTPKGQVYAQLLPDMLSHRLSLIQEENEGEEQPLSVWVSTLKRTNQTAQYLSYPKLRWKALDEINAGRCDGMSYEEIAEAMPEEYNARQENKLTYRYPYGESYLDVIQRLEPVIIEMEREQESICVVGHRAVLRAIYAYCLRMPLEDCPDVEIPLHTLIELTPMPDGTMQSERIPIDVPSPPSSPSSPTFQQLVTRCHRLEDMSDSESHLSRTFNHRRSI